MTPDVGSMRERLTTAVRNRYRQGAVASYGAGLGCDCGDCPVLAPEAFVPAPRGRVPADQRETVRS